MKYLFFPAIFFLLSCTPDRMTGEAPPCPLAFLLPDSIPAPGQYRSPPLTRPLGSVTYLFFELKEDFMRAWTETTSGHPATPATKAERFSPYTFDGTYLDIGGTGFKPRVSFAADSSFIVYWMEREFLMRWKKPLDPPLGIREPYPPPFPSCPE